jgi:hypothetical protein
VRRRRSWRARRARDAKSGESRSSRSVVLLESRSSSGEQRSKILRAVPLVASVDSVRINFPERKPQQRRKRAKIVTRRAARRFSLAEVSDTNKIQSAVARTNLKSFN